MPIEKLLGIDQSVVANESKKKAVFFSENIINLEKKQYEELFRKQDGGLELVLSTPEQALQAVLDGLPPDVLLKDLPAIEESCKYSALKRFLLNQTLNFNALIARVRRETSYIQARVAGSFKADPAIDSLIEILRHGEVPKSWKIQSRKDRLSLDDWLKRLRDQQDFFVKLADNNFLRPNVFNLKFLSDPRGLLDAYQLDCTNQRAPSMRFDEIIMTYKLTTVFERNSSGLPMVNLFHLGRNLPPWFEIRAWTFGSIERRPSRKARYIDYR